MCVHIIMCFSEIASTSVFLYRHVRIKFSLTHALALLRFLLQTIYSRFYRRFMSELLSVLYYCHIYRLLSNTNNIHAYRNAQEKDL